jgi:hypothetical protein
MSSLTGGDSGSMNPGSGGRHGYGLDDEAWTGELDGGYGNNAPVAQRRQVAA